MADNEKMVLTKASLNQTKAAAAKANTTTAAKKLAAAKVNAIRSAASAVATAKMSQQKANVMHGRIKQATA